MGNLVSQDTHTNNMRGGSTYTNNFDELQKKLEKIVRNSKNNTVSDTINFGKQSESDIDFESIKEYAQNGGGHDFVTAIPRRTRYSNQTVLKGGNSEPKPNALSSISEEDFKLLQEVLKRHNRANQQPQDLQQGGCGCAGNDNLISDTSPQPVNYDILKGGSVATKDEDKDKKKKKHVDEDDDEISDADDDDYDSESEDDSDESSEEESNDEDDEDDDYDESAEGDELARTSKSSSSSSSSQKKHKPSKKHQKRHSSDSHSEYLRTSQTAGSSEEIVIDSKYLYSDNNTFYGSDEHSEYFKAIKNRSML